MNIREEILREHSKKQTIKIVNFIGNNKVHFATIMKLFFSNETIVTQRAAWVVSNCFEKYPELIQPFLARLIKNLEKKNLHDAVKRNTLRMLQYIDLPEKLQGIAFQNSMNLFTSSEEPIAVKVFAMSVLAGICEQEPELKKELKIRIEEQLPYSSAGFKAEPPEC